ncbi:hypothetical protein BDQ94DRAFT_177481 [Aspergillus welwitschiae]|uniref:Uncharacterized protein n=1 Tax=Aspergillus welwitschiae TaxID=1341132 RepID=A0A3F3PI30_9EURO|nr:hypothetical protein BDQ94DRAFT_177481 [Aspergillus welwitschiae]RDH26527.1 hypothetical protein BDQ94DRAFT_177481 [Aspergillus welwitschiae]
MLPRPSLASSYSTLTALVPILLHHQLGFSAIDGFTPASDLSQLVLTMGENNATCEKPPSSVPKGTCCQTAVKSPLSIGSPSFLLDPHQLASTLQAMRGSMAMLHVSEGECKKRAHLLMFEPHAACGNMGSENSLADFYPKTPPNSPRMAVSEAVSIEHVSILES